MERINSERLWNDIMTLAEFTEPDKPWTRRSFTNYYNSGRDWLINKMIEANLEVEIDSAANIIGRKEGKNKNLPPIVIGSHIDTVPAGGRFDGISGVLAGLEVIRTLNEEQIILNHTIELVDFTAEEPSAYGLSTVGSRAWSGNLTKKMLDYTNSLGESLASAIQFAGGNPKNIMKQALIKPISLYLELHIEQGPILYEKETSLGVVSGIAGIKRYKIIVEGNPDHAGTTPMHMRKDAINGACEMSLELEKLTKQDYCESVVGTIGEFNVFPNASNVIPGKVEFSVDIRSISDEVIEEVCNLFLRKVKEIGKDRKLDINYIFISKINPVIINDDIKSLLKRSCESLEPNVFELPSGAGHDASQISKICPVGMIFIPCEEGRSHCPDEWIEEEDLAKGTTALLNAVQIFSKSKTSF